ncbi:PepSY domain-containing protein [Erythrobacter sp.]|jgi:hypothetical protein|uniref:PepSY domain-containing protein n=1 Tax=Erythrobacter sp. TaxID=1042 RepID=UPI002EC862DE|nr:PepSY domain-containing protein [Erythrobacter sp.]
MTSVPSLFALIASAMLLTGIGPTATNAAAASAAAQEQSRSDQGEARREMRAGNQLSLREIERRVVPKMRGSEYLGPSYDSTARAYRLKFIRDGRVTYVDVDARSGRIIKRSR